MPSDRFSRSVRLEIDVTDAANLGVQAHAVVTVVYPDQWTLVEAPIVAFALPGAGYNRHYFTFDMPGTATGGQAGWHAQRGWIFVAIDTLGVGEASLPDPADLGLQCLSAVNHAIVGDVLQRLALGTVSPDLASVADPIVLGLGQSMGGGLTIVQQAHHDTYDAIAILGFSATWTSTRKLPGSPPAGVPYLARDTPLPRPDPRSHEQRSAVAANRLLLRLQADAERYPTKSATPPGWHFHFDDVPAEVRERDLTMTGEAPPWRSTTVPGAVFQMLAPGSLGPEAAAIVVPVLSAFGERDVTEDPRMEHKAFRHAVDFSSFICPRMGHMHNFASSRGILWSRVHSWGGHVAELKGRLPEGWPAGLFSDSY
jgi:pimeloyl-ACP methyl ester carboxylesterase